MFETITYDGLLYPRFQSSGYASRFAFPFAKEFCEGVGYDIGYSKKEWLLPGAIGIDSKDGLYDANNLPPGQVDYIFSSHCLEHVPDWVGTLDYWISKVRQGGVIYLYLPDFSQPYWRPWNNRKHLHIFTPQIFQEYCEKHFVKSFITAPDMNSSFHVAGEVG